MMYINKNTLHEVKDTVIYLININRYDYSTRLYPINISFDSEISMYKYDNTIDPVIIFNPYSMYDQAFKTLKEAEEEKALIESSIKEMLNHIKTVESEKETKEQYPRLSNHIHYELNKIIGDFNHINIKEMKG